MVSSVSQKKNCIVCGEIFTKKDCRSLTCGRRCGARLGHRRSGKRAFNADPKKISEGVRLWHEERRRLAYPLLADRKWLEKRYVVEELTQSEIGKIVGCTRTAVKTALYFHKIPLRDRKYRSERSREKCSGENNWNWKGGKYNGEVCGFSETNHVRIKLRKALIKERGFCCEWCGIVPKRRRLLHLHHTRPYRYEKTHTSVLLLCQKCHATADRELRRLALKFFASHGWPGLDGLITTLKSEASTNI
ncbi:hypothetical protein LCGC14_0820720 [marine sediment metagenome]|uniref:HNH nuclease domain-containing protein n=1 Tax=marine sediment metagenome TaxID=412755 RepID=A0A0F9Q465_9ZZZZ